MHKTTKDRFPEGKYLAEKFDSLLFQPCVLLRCGMLIKINWVIELMNSESMEAGGSLDVDQ